MQRIDNISSWLIIGYGLSAIGYVAHLNDALPKYSTIFGMCLISLAYACMCFAKVIRERKARDDTEKTLTITGYVLASIFFFLIHIFPQLTFNVRYYDIFGAVGYGVLSVGTAFLPLIVPLGYGIATLYYIFGSYQKLSEPAWMDRIHLLARTILAVIYGMMVVNHH